MIMNEPLGQAAQGILDEITAYHRDRLYAFQESASNRRAANDRNLPWSLNKAILAMAAGKLDGAEREFFAETAKLAGKSFDAQRIHVPWGVFHRDLTAGNASAGGYLIGAEQTLAYNALRPYSVVMRAGVQVLEHQTGNIFAAIEDVTPIVYWLSTEATQATQSDPTVRQVAMTPKVAISDGRASRNFWMQANPESFIRRALLRSAGAAVDTAVLQGTGVSGQPMGILNTTGISTTSGTSLAWGGIVDMKTNAAAVDVPEEGIAFVGTPAVRGLLEKREKATGSGFIWDSGRVANCSAGASSTMPSASLLAGPFSSVLLPLWSNGFEIEINPHNSTLFKSGIVEYRVLIAMDVGIVAPVASFTAARTIT